MAESAPTTALAIGRAEPISTVVTTMGADAPNAEDLVEESLLFICTGGTIDKDYPRTAGGYAFEFNASEPAVKRILERCPLHGWASHAIEVPFQKDSLEVTADDRRALVALLARVRHTRVVVTHGTDTMIETARALDATARRLGKTVIVTGAMRPERFGNSDADVNVGCAIGSVRTLPAGAYVSMGGVARRCLFVARNERGEFVSSAPRQAIAVAAITTDTALVQRSAPAAPAGEGAACSPELRGVVTASVVPSSPTAPSRGVGGEAALSGKKRRPSTPVLESRYRARLLETGDHKDVMTIKAISDILECTSRAAGKLLVKIVKSDLVHRTRTNKSKCYSGIRAKGPAVDP